MHYVGHDRMTWFVRKMISLHFLQFWGRNCTYVADLKHWCMDQTTAAMFRGGNTDLQHVEIRRYMHGRWRLATLGVELISEEAASQQGISP